MSRNDDRLIYEYKLDLALTPDLFSDMLDWIVNREEVEYDGEIEDGFSIYLEAEDGRRFHLEALDGEFGGGVLRFYLSDDEECDMDDGTLEMLADELEHICEICEDNAFLDC